jgi:GDPmannose 4,6-dehydratase
VSRKITRGVAAIATGKQDVIYLGNLDAKRDWGHAKDYVEGMWRMLQHPEPIDFVLATGITTTIRDFVSIAFEKINVQIKFAGKGINEVGIVEKNDGPYPIELGAEVIKIDDRYYRPTEVDLLIGDATKAKQLLGWEPTYTLDALIEEMMVHDIKLYGG